MEDLASIANTKSSTGRSLLLVIFPILFNILNLAQAGSLESTAQPDKNQCAEYQIKKITRGSLPDSNYKISPYLLESIQCLSDDQNTLYTLNCSPQNTGPAMAKSKTPAIHCELLKYDLMQKKIIQSIAMPEIDHAWLNNAGEVRAYCDNHDYKLFSQHHQKLYSLKDNAITTQTIDLGEYDSRYTLTKNLVIAYTINITNMAKGWPINAPSFEVSVLNFQKGNRIFIHDLGGNFYGVHTNSTNERIYYLSNKNEIVVIASNTGHELYRETFEGKTILDAVFPKSNSNSDEVYLILQDQISQAVEVVTFNLANANQKVMFKIPTEAGDNLSQLYIVKTQPLIIQNFTNDREKVYFAVNKTTVTLAPKQSAICTGTNQVVKVSDYTYFISGNYPGKEFKLKKLAHEISGCSIINDHEVLLNARSKKLYRWNPLNGDLELLFEQPPSSTELPVLANVKAFWFASNVLGVSKLNFKSKLAVKPIDYLHFDYQCLEKSGKPDSIKSGKPATKVY